MHYYDVEMFEAEWKDGPSIVIELTQNTGIVLRKNIIERKTEENLN